MEDHAKPNLDVLIVGIATSPDAQACARVLSSYDNITVFTQDPGFEVDLVILATGDLYDNVKAAVKYPNFNFLAVQTPITKAAIGTYILSGICNIVEPICTKEEFYKLVEHAAGISGVLSKNKLTQLLNSEYFLEDGDPVTYKEAAYLGAITRGLQTKEIAKIFHTSVKDVRMFTYRALKKLKIKPAEFRSIQTICKYGTVDPGPKYKTYVFPGCRIRRSGFYSIPRFIEEEG